MAVGIVRRGLDGVDQVIAAAGQQNDAPGLVVRTDEETVEQGILAAVEHMRQGIARIRAIHGDGATRQPHVHQQI
ncbi:hypothetical protein D3C81_2063030 [compost metagenome]